MVLGVILLNSGAFGENIVFVNTEDTSWGNAANWNNWDAMPANRVPIWNDVAYITEAQICDISGPANTQRLLVGAWTEFGTATWGWLNINAGASLSAWYDFGTESGSSWIAQTGGVVNCGYLNVGTSGGQENWYSISGGNINVGGGGYLSVGHGNVNAHGHFTQTGGIVNSNFLFVGMRGGQGEYTITGGTLNARNGAAPGFGLCLGWSDTIPGGKGTLNIGDAAQSQGVFTGNPKIEQYSGSVINGWGTINSNYIALLDGIVDANGYGVERTLDLSSFSTAGATAGNISNNGFYAVNKGKLLLPSIAVSTGSNSYKWGDASTSSPTTVNGLVLSFTNVTTGGNCSISLLSPDRSEVGSGPLRFIGVWNFASPLVFTSANMTIRYDDQLAIAKGITEANLKLYRYNAGSHIWTDITSSIDTVNNRISGTTNSLSMFAVAEPIVTALDCNEVWLLGDGYEGDLNRDCRVNFQDWAQFSEWWFACNDPADEDCQ
jgi:hypothetical protein